MKRAFVILTCGLLTGCVHYQPQPLAPDQSAAQLEARQLDDAGLRSFVEKNLGHPLSQWPPPRWNLELLAFAAYYYQPSLDVARAQWHVAEAAAISAGARPNPTASVAPGFTANSPGGVSPWLMAAGFDWPVETAGKRGLRLAQAKQLACAARFNFITAAWQVRADVRDSLAAYRFAENQVTTLGEKIAIQEEIVAKLDGRFQAGAIAAGEVTGARIALGKLEVELNSAQESKAAARTRAAAAVGISASTFANLPLAMTLYTPQLSDAQLAYAKALALHNRADLLSALADYAASEAALQLEIAKQYPDVRLSPGYEYDQGANKWRLGLSLELPVLNQNQGPIAEAKARRAESAASFLALQAKVIAEIDTAIESFQRTRRSYFDFLPAVNDSQKQERAMAAQVRAGAADNLDLLNVRLERLTTVAMFDEAGYRSEQAFGQLEDAMQQLLEQRADVIAPTPPANLEINPREEKAKP